MIPSIFFRCMECGLLYYSFKSLLELNQHSQQKFNRECEKETLTSVPLIDYYILFLFFKDACRANTSF